MNDCAKRPVVICEKPTSTVSYIFELFLVARKARFWIFFYCVCFFLNLINDLRNFDNYVDYETYLSLITRFIQYFDTENLLLPS